MFRVARMFAIGATVLAAALGLTFGLFLPSVARADDPPPTTVPTPTVPTPDPAPPPKPKPKPTPPPRQVSHTPTYQQPVASAPATRPAAAVKPKVGAPGGSFDLGSLLIVLGLGFAIACFTIALVPATYVKWRPAAIFVSERQVDLTVVGLALLVTAAFTLFWTQGP